MAVQSLMAPEELTVHQVQALAPEFIEAVCNGGQVNIDLSQVCNLDTAGVQLLLMLHREAARALTQLDFANPSPIVCEMLTFYELGHLLDASPPHVAH